MCEVCVEAKGCRKNMRVIFVEKSEFDRARGLCQASGDLSSKVAS